MSDRQALLVSSGNGPGECRQGVAHLLAKLADEAARLGLDLDMAERPAPHGPSSAVVVLTGRGAAAMAERWEGVVLWRCRSALRPKHPRKTWFLQIFRLAPAIAEIRIDPDTVEMQAIRAGGPGGQHQNKTASAIRARWTDPAGRVWSVAVRDSRSQHQNRRIALERIAGLIAAEQAEADLSRRGALHDLRGRTQRGAPRRVFEGAGYREVGGAPADARPADGLGLPRLIGERRDGMEVRGQDDVAER